MEDEQIIDGQRYQFKKLGLSDAKEVISKLDGIGFLDGDAVGSLIKDVTELDWLQRKLFGEHVSFLNDQGDWIPMAPEIVDNHFHGRLKSYLELLHKAIDFQFSDFFVDG